MKQIIISAFVILLSVLLLSCGGRDKDKRKILYYANPMDPTIHSDRPMKDPMGMDYIAVYEEDGQKGNTGSDSTGVKGYTEITISPEKQQMIGVKKDKVQYRVLTETVKTYGTIAHDNELYNTLQEYKNTAGYYNELKAKGAAGESLAPAKSLLQAVEFKLKLAGLDPSKIRLLTDDPSIILVSEKSRRAVVYAEIYERDIKSVRINQEAVVTTSYSNRKFSGNIIAIAPSVNMETRTLRTMILIRNITSDIRHESFVNVEIKVPAGSILSIPEDSVIDTGSRKIVFVDRGEGKFEPRTVSLGRIINGYYEVTGGVSVNETVITGANFLLDSESQLKAAIRGM